MEMAKVPTAQKLGIATRIATRQIRQTRTFSAVMRAGKATTSHWLRALSLLWLEVTGFVFVALSVIGVLAFFGEYTRYHAGHASSGRVILALAFSLLFGWFGLTSFLRVKKKE
jgi:hypothetical protein